jgi:hypothetical protein
VVDAMEAGLAVAVPFNTTELPLHTPISGPAFVVKLRIVTRAVSLAKQLAAVTVKI